MRRWIRKTPSLMVLIDDEGNGLASVAETPSGRSGQLTKFIVSDGGSEFATLEEAQAAAERFADRE